MTPNSDEVGGRDRGAWADLRWVGRRRYLADLSLDAPGVPLRWLGDSCWSHHHSEAADRDEAERVGSPSVEEPDWS